MKVIREVSSNIIVYSYYISFGVQGVVIAGGASPVVKPPLYEEIDLPNGTGLPENYTDGGWTFNGAIWSESARAQTERLARGKEDLKKAVVDLMVSKQDGGIVFNGIAFSTDTDAKSDIAGAKMAPKGNRKIVTRKGSTAIMNNAGIDALFDAVETYRQSVMNRAHDLLIEIEAATTEQLAAIDIKSGWPSKVINS